MPFFTEAKQAADELCSDTINLTTETTMKSPTSEELTKHLNHMPKGADRVAYAIGFLCVKIDNLKEALNEKRD